MINKVKQELKLTIELVPKSLWGRNIHNICKNNKKKGRDYWKKIKEDLINKEGKGCWICRRTDKYVKLEAHEFWGYDEENKVQKLNAIHHICLMCHKIKHFGKSLIIGFSENFLIEYFCKVNSFGSRDEVFKEDFEEHYKKVMGDWRRRNKIDWKQDFGEYSQIVEILKENAPCPI